MKTARAIACAFAVIAATGSAGAVEISFVGQVDGRASSPAQSAFINSVFPVGSLITGHFSYSINAPIIYAFTNYLGADVTYRGDLLEMGTGSFLATALFDRTEVIDNAYMGYDQFGVNANAYDHALTAVGTPIPVTSIDVGFYDTTGKLFSSAALPPNGIRLSDFNGGNFDLHFAPSLNDPNKDRASVHGHVISVSATQDATVPEPSESVLMLIGLSGIAAASLKARTRLAKI